jgi:hypothetical protein
MVAKRGKCNDKTTNIGDPKCSDVCGTPTTMKVTLARPVILLLKPTSTKTMTVYISISRISTCWYAITSRKPDNHA